MVTTNQQRHCFFDAVHCIDAVGLWSPSGVESTITTVFLLTVSAWSLHVVSKSGTLYCHRMEAPLKSEGRRASQPAQPSVFLTYLGNMVAACCPRSGTLSSFSALMLLVGQQKGRPTCKNSAITILKSLLLCTVLTWGNLT